MCIRTLPGSTAVPPVTCTSPVQSSPSVLRLSVLRRSVLRRSVTSVARTTAAFRGPRQCMVGWAVVGMERVEQGSGEARGWAEEGGMCIRTLPGSTALPAVTCTSLATSLLHMTVVDRGQCQCTGVPLSPAGDLGVPENHTVCTCACSKSACQCSCTWCRGGWQLRISPQH